MPTPKLEQFNEIFESGEPFSVTESQYKHMTGLSIPKSNSYLTNSSAIAKRAKSYGYKIVVQERTISFEKEQINHE